MPYANANDTTIHYRESGDGEPLLLLHGGGLTHRLWDPQVEHLAATHRCVAMDLRGHGETRSHRATDIYLVREHARDVAALLDHLGWHRAHVAGLSLGGMVGMELALAAPERVRSLVTIGSPAAIDGGPAVRALLSIATRRVFRGLDEGGMTWFGTYAAARLTEDPAVAAYLMEDSPRSDADEFRRVWRGIVAYDARRRLAGIAAPTLVIVGTSDRNLRSARAAASLIPGARLELVPGAGHITNREQPAKINALLASWLAEQAYAGGESERHPPRV